jgi:hypothetical protein
LPAVESEPAAPAETFLPSMWGDEGAELGEGAHSTEEPAGSAGQTFTLAPEANAVASAPASETFSSELQQAPPAQPTAVPVEESARRPSRWPVIGAALLLLVAGGFGLSHLVSPSSAPPTIQDAAPAEESIEASPPEPGSANPAAPGLPFEPGTDPVQERETPAPESRSAQPSEPAQPQPAEPPLAATVPTSPPAPVMGELFINTLPPGQVASTGRPCRASLCSAPP